MPALSWNECNIMLLIIHCLFYIIHIYILTLTILTQPPEQNSEAAAGGVLKNFANFTGKHLCWSLFFTKLQAFRPATLLKKTPTQVFSCEIWEILKNTYFEKHLNKSERLLLCMDYFIIYWFLQPLQYTIFIFTNNFFIAQLKQ